MKNCRQVCACRGIGELKFAKLQGTVVVGLYALGVCFSQLFSYNHVGRTALQAHFFKKSPFGDL